MVTSDEAQDAACIGLWTYVFISRDVCLSLHFLALATDSPGAAMGNLRIPDPPEHHILCHLLILRLGYTMF